jgi:hypothetical protein
MALTHSDEEHVLSATERYTTELFQVERLPNGGELYARRVEGVADGLEIKGVLKLFYGADRAFDGYEWDGTALDADQLQVLLDLFDE